MDLRSTALFLLLCMHMLCCTSHLSLPRVALNDDSGYANENYYLHYICKWIGQALFLRVRVHISKVTLCSCSCSFPPYFTLCPITMPTTLGAGGWSPLVTDRNQWLQVDLGSRKQVFTIVTQGRYGSSDWTSKYRLLYSETQKNWRPYLQDGNIWVSKKLMSRHLQLLETIYLLRINVHE